MNEVFFTLLGVSFGIVLTSVKDIIFSKYIRKKRAEYLSIQLITYLDDFMSKCINVSNDDGTGAREHRPMDPCVPGVKLPEFKPFSLKGVDWKSLPSDLMYEILIFPKEIEIAKNRIDIEEEFDDDIPEYPDFFDQRQCQFSNLGLKSIQLIDKLQKTLQHSKKKI